jgi:hypothetical protein
MNHREKIALGIYLYLTIGAIVGIKTHSDSWGQETADDAFECLLEILFWPFVPIGWAFGIMVRGFYN